MLPGVSGCQICTRMRAHSDTTPVLMLTARDGEYDEAEGLDSGADDYLTKPFSFVVLAARIRALARRARTPTSHHPPGGRTVATSGDPKEARACAGCAPDPGRTPARPSSRPRAPNASEGTTGRT